MEQIESVIIQVSPDFENNKIAEMRRFGWNLQSRQEVVGHLREADTPDNAPAAGRGTMESATSKRTYKYDQYVKLYFVRARYGWGTGLLWYWDQCPAASLK
jgi:hypothetical protein